MSTPTLTISEGQIDLNIDGGPTGLATTGIVGALTLTKTGSTARTATFPDRAITIAGVSGTQTTGRLAEFDASGNVTDSLIQDGVTAGALTIAKTGTTARTATFPDGDIGVQSDTEERSANFTARVHGQYVATATLTVTDPTPDQGHEYVVHVRNGTATVGGTAYIAGQTIWRSYHSGAWSNIVLASLGTAQSFTALQTFTAGLTVSAGTTALQDVTCTTLTASGTVASSKASAAASITDANSSLKLYDPSLGSGLFGMQTSGSPYTFQLQVADATMASKFPLSLNPLGGVVNIGAGGLACSGGITCASVTASGDISINPPALTSARLILNRGGAGQQSGVYLTDATGTKYNWYVGAQNYVDDAFEIDQSTTVGGSTYSTVRFSINPSGVCSIFGSTPGTGTAPAGQVLIGGGAIKAAGGITCASQVIGTDPGGSELLRVGGSVRCTTLSPSSTLSMIGAQYVYLRGDASTDGSVRFSSQSAGTMLIEKRASGSWVSIGSFA
jgi:hypothetical protein